METTIINVRLMPGSEDAPLTAAEFQQAPREFEQTLRVNGLVPAIGLRFLDADDGDTPALFNGAFGFPATALPVLGTLLGAWLNAKYGRKVHLRIGANGEIEADAQTADDVERLVAATRAYHESGRHEA